jgi:hypothetical protein
MLRTISLSVRVLNKIIMSEEEVWPGRCRTVAQPLLQLISTLLRPCLQTLDPSVAYQLWATLGRTERRRRGRSKKGPNRREHAGTLDHATQLMNRTCAGGQTGGDGRAADTHTLSPGKSTLSYLGNTLLPTAAAATCSLSILPLRSHAPTPAPTPPPRESTAHCSCITAFQCVASLALWLQLDTRGE